MGPYLLSLELSTISHGLYQQMKFGLQLLMKKTVRLFCLRIVITDTTIFTQGPLTRLFWSF